MPDIDISAVRDLPPDADLVVEGESPRGSWRVTNRLKRHRLGALVVKSPSDYFALRVVPVARGSN
jgi:hypothetical protein